MIRNYICEMVSCKHWDDILNGNEDVFLFELSKECKKCKHTKIKSVYNEGTEICNYVEREM